jgi:penicillin-binding protein 2
MAGPKARLTKPLGYQTMILPGYSAESKAERESLLQTYRFLVHLLAGSLITGAACGSLAQAMTPVKKKTSSKQAASRIALRHVALAAAASPAKTPAKAAPAKTSGHWRAPNYADSTAGDIATGEDPIARQAAVQGLGKLNGAIVVSDPATGRVLAMVNQKLALKSGFQPCSTIKVPVALAALSEAVVDRNTQIRLYGKTSIAMTEALAKSSNQYFASLGEKLGFDRVSYYARLFGLGEKAGLDIDAEQPGILPAATPKSGMGMMTSFGDGITLTPLEFAGLLGAVANGGTLYYLQYPKTQQEAETLEPRVKRRLEIGDLIPEIKPGMQGAVEYGTARRIGSDDPNEAIFGKTGTCTDTRTPTHLGWFGSFAESNRQKVVVVVLLTGGSAVSGPAAAGVAGQVYKNLEAASFFAQAEPAGGKFPASIGAGNGFANFMLSNAIKP